MSVGNARYAAKGAPCTLVNLRKPSDGEPAVPRSTTTGYLHAVGKMGISQAIRGAFNRSRRRR